MRNDLELIDPYSTDQSLVMYTRQLNVSALHKNQILFFCCETLNNLKYSSILSIFYLMFVRLHQDTQPTI